mgnify:CR=1 FL=1
MKGTIEGIRSIAVFNLCRESEVIHGCGEDHAVCPYETGAKVFLKGLFEDAEAVYAAAIAPGTGADMFKCSIEM